MSSKIRIKNLPFETERSAVQDLLTMVGDVRTIRVAFEHGETTAYVQMMNDGQAQDCIDRLNKHRFRGHVLAVHADVVNVKVPMPSKVVVKSKAKPRIAVAR